MRMESKEALDIIRERIDLDEREYAEQVPEYIEALKLSAELLQADAEGRLVVLPVKVGEPCSVRRIAEKTTIVDGILKYAALVVESDKENMLMHPCNVFAEREEAEAELEKMVGESCV